MSRSHFVDDLIPEVLSWNVWWPRDLLRLAVLSKTWLFYSRKLLYTRPILRSFPACSAFSRSVQNNPHLRCFVREIALCPTVDNRSFGSEEMRAIRFILGLEGLRSVHLGGELAVCAERFLQCLTDSHSVEELVVDGSLVAESLRSPPSLEWDEVMACKFSAVKRLRLAHLELDIIYPSSVYELQVTDLVLDNVDILGGNLPWMLQDAVALKHLSVSGESSTELDEHIRLALELYSLESLQYQVGTSPSWNLALFDTRDIASTASLRTLYLDGVRVDSETLRTIHSACPMLEQLFISGRCVPLTRDDWIGCIASGLFPALRKLGLPEGTFCPPFKKWSASLEPGLQKACSLRGVHLLSCC